MLFEGCLFGFIVGSHELRITVPIAVTAVLERVKEQAGTTKQWRFPEHSLGNRQHLLVGDRVHQLAEPVRMTGEVTWMIQVAHDSRIRSTAGFARLWIGDAPLLQDHITYVTQARGTLSVKYARHDHISFR